MNSRLGYIFLSLGIFVTACGSGNGNNTETVNTVETVVSRSLNDTAQTACYDNVGNAGLCSLVDFPGQDGDYGRDSTLNNNNDGEAGFSFTKLDSAGNELSVDSTNWSCVKDNVTGLVWEVKEALPGNLHSADNSYTWYSSDTTRNSGEAGTMDGGDCVASRCDTEGYVNAVNATGFCGRQNWRMPEREEFNSILRMAITSGDARLDSNFFPYHVLQNYWTGTSPAWSSTIGANGGTANYIMMRGFGYLPKANKFRVRLVSGRRPTYNKNVNALYGQTCKTTTTYAATPNSRFVEENDGRVTDRETNLTWLRCPLGRTWDPETNFCTGAATNYTWMGALQEVANINAGNGIAGYTDWRIPNYKELISIAEVQCVSPAINLEIFPIYNASNIYVFWSSTSTAGINGVMDRAHRISFRSSAFLDSLNKDSSQPVLLVRGL